MILYIYANSQKGFIRNKNEDCILIQNEILRNIERFYIIELKEEPFIFAVLDGLGGHQSGEKASEITAKLLYKKIRNLPLNLDKEEFKKYLEEILNKINKTILRIDKKMGTTLTAVLYYSEEFYFIHIGDTRIYRFRNSCLTQITEDHTLQNITKNPNLSSNILANSIGIDHKLYLDFDLLSKRIFPEDYFFLCSDGFWNFLQEEDIIKTLKNTQDLVQIGRTLFSNIEPKSDDNISLILFQIHKEKKNGTI